MRYNNGNEVKKIKRVFFQGSGIIALAAVVLFLFELNLFGIIALVLFSVWILFFFVAEFQFIEFISDNNRIVFRFYKAISLSKPEYSSIDFQKQMLKEAEFEDSFFGKDTDLTLTISTSKGIADYPTISLLGVPKAVRKKIRKEITGISEK